MKKIIKNILLLLMFGTLFLSQACKDSDCDTVSYNTYEFVMPFTLSPAQVTYHIGDTITISSIVENPILERKTYNMYLLDNFKFYLITHLYYMDTLINDYSDFNRFMVIFDTTSEQSIFTYSDGHNSMLGQYNYANNIYSYNIKLIAQEKGRYLFTQGSDIDYVGSNQYFDGKCKNSELTAKFYMNGRNNNNSYLLDEALNSNFKLYLNDLDAQYLDNGGYCFKVID